LTYCVELTRRAEKAFLALPKRDRRLIGRRLLALADNPRPRGAKALAGPLVGHYRLRVGDYRIVYTIEDDRLLVIVVRVGPRHSVYGEAERGV